jgi:importin-5
VLTQAAKCFAFVAQALEAETLTGATATRVCAAVKQLVTTAGLDANALLASLSPEAQLTVRQHFG